MSGYSEIYLKGFEFLQLGAVTSGMVLLVVIPFIPVAFFLFRGEPWPKVLLIAITIGCCLQAISGLLWSHWVGKWPNGEIVLLAVFWSVSLWWSIWRAKENSGFLFKPLDKKSHLTMVMIFFAAFLVRSLHPLDVAYLGQSDAYAHLHYLNNISSQGSLTNPAYPSGYHWILALPVLVFSIDSYWVARFGGAFFGVGLVLAIFVMLDQLFNRRAALFGSFCAACFPPMTLLMKTGVGAFANQFGLFLLPVIFLFYTLHVSNERKKNGISGVLLLALGGLVATVPMMLLHVLVIFSLERFVTLIRAPRLWFSKTVRIILVVLPAICLLLFHLSDLGPGQRFQTANVLMEYGGKKKPLAEKVTAKVKTEATKYDPVKRKLAVIVVDSPYFQLLIDYFSVKRKGFGNIFINMVGWLLAGIFFCFIIYGFITARASYLMIGLWGGVTSVQAATGFLQFSSYQREGWSLLVAICCVSGILAALIVQPVAGNRFYRPGAFSLMLFSFIWTVLHPPQHPEIKSSAEDLLVRSIRFFGQNPADLSTVCGNKKDALCRAANFLIADLPLKLVTRRFTGWENQGEIAPNVLQQESALQVVTIGKDEARYVFQPGNQYVVLIDDNYNVSKGNVVSAFTMVTPSIVKATMRQQDHLFRINKKILEDVQNLSQALWKFEQISLSDSLTTFIVTPSTSRID